MDGEAGPRTLVRAFAEALLEDSRCKFPVESKLDLEARAEALKLQHEYMAWRATRRMEPSVRFLKRVAHFDRQMRASEGFPIAPLYIDVGGRAGYVEAIDP